MGNQSNVNKPYEPIAAAFLGRTWENVKTWIDMSILLVDKEGVTLSKLMGDYGVKTERFPKISKRNKGKRR